jgi:hypothetical protein
LMIFLAFFSLQLALSGDWSVWLPRVNKQQDVKSCAFQF